MYSRAPCPLGTKAGAVAGGPAGSRPMEFFDPHFHIWDLTPSSVSGHDASVVHEVPWVAGDPKLYGTAEYEADCDGHAALKHVGGVFIDAMSVCHVDKPGTWLQDKCLAEARWVAESLATSQRLYRLSPSACLEDPDVGATLAKLAAIPGVVGIRQILNHEPSWPRNAVLGDLLDSAEWRAGYAKLEAVGFSFDCQLNPPQYIKAAALMAKHPGIPVVINHMGTPTAADLGERSAQYWQGLEALAKLPHVAIKISMLCYTVRWHGRRRRCTTAAPPPPPSQ